MASAMSSMRSLSWRLGIGERFANAIGDAWDADAVQALRGEDFHFPAEKFLERAGKPEEVVVGRPREIDQKVDVTAVGLAVPGVGAEEGNVAHGVLREQVAVLPERAQNIPPGEFDLRPLFHGRATCHLLGKDSAAWRTN